MLKERAISVEARKHSPPLVKTKSDIGENGEEEKKGRRTKSSKKSEKMIRSNERVDQDLSG